MAQSVDTKIVELKFNNDNFADKVDTTLQKLKQLNDDIAKVGVSDAFKNLSRSVKDVDVSGINEGVKEVHANFSKLEVVATTAFGNITNSAVNLGKKLIANLVTPINKGILQGGLSRARNIEQATFSFEGQKIGKSAGNEALSYYKEVMDAVLGTSYSYDVAAKAASQFAASNVGVIESVKKLADGTEIAVKTLDPTTSTHKSSMTTALLGVAGVAAMTGSSFDDIAHIFTKVAGQGKVMNDDLDQLATRGLNARAIIGQQLKMTEQEVRDLAKSGDLTFAQFSKAMSDAFGAHAKDSTLMFQGALDDVNAALARIGADFYGPALNAGRDILNSVTPLVDAIHTKLNPALDSTNSIMGKASKSLSQYLDMLSYMIEMFPKMDRSLMGDWILDHMNAWTNIADLYGRGSLKDAVEQLEQVSKTWDGMDGQGINGKQMIADYYSAASNVELLSKYLKISDSDAKKLIEDGAVGADQISTIVDGMIKDGTVGFNEFYKSFHKLWSESEKLMNNPEAYNFFNEYVRQAIRAEEPSERFNKHLETFAAILNGVKSLASSFSTILGGLADIFLTLIRHLTPFGKIILQAAEDTAKFVVYIADFIATSESFSQVIDSIVHVIAKFFELINVSKLAQFVLGTLAKVFDFISKAIETVQNGIAKVISTISDIFGKIVDKLNSIVSSSEELVKVLQAVKQAGIVVMLINLIGMIAKPIELLDNLSKSVSNVGSSISKTFKAIGSVFESIAGLAGKIGAVIDEVRNALVKFQELLVATAILELGIAIAVLAGAFFLLTKIDTDKMSGVAAAIISFAAIAGSFLVIPKFFKNITNVKKAWEKSVNDIMHIGAAFLMMAGAVAIMAAAIYKLAKLDPKKMLMATGAVEALLVTMAIMAKLLSGTVTSTRSTGIKSLWSGKATKTSTSMTKGLLGIVAIAEAVKIAAKALTMVAKVSDPNDLYNALAVIEALMWSMFLISKWLSKEKPDKMAKGIGGLVAMALAMRMLVKPIVELSGMAAVDNNAMWSAVGAVGALLAIMTVLIKYLSGTDGLVKAGIGLAIMAASIRILSEVVVAFASLDLEAMWNAIIGMAVAIGSVVLALSLVDTDGLLSKAIAFVLVANALKVLAGVVMTFGENNEQAWSGIGALAIALLGLAGACYVFKKVPIGGILKLFLTLALGAVIVAAFGAAIGVFGVGMATFGVGLAVLANGAAQAQAVGGTIIGIMAGLAIAIAILSTVGLPAVGVILALAAAFLIFGAGMIMVGAGLTNIASAVTILNELKNDLGDVITKITTFIVRLKNMSKDTEAIGESFKTISEPLESIKKSSETITEQINKLAKSYTDLVGKSSECITALADSLTTISKLNEDSFGKATEAMKSFISGLADISKDAQTVAATATDISTSLGTLKTAFEEVKTVVDDFKQRSVNTFTNLGTSLNSIAEPINTLASLQGNLDALATDIITFVNNLGSMQEKAAAISAGATAISDSLNQVGDAATIAKTGFEGLTKTTANILTSMGSGMDAIAHGFQEIVKIKDDLPSAASAIEEFYKKLENLNSTATSIAQGTRAVASAIKTLGQAAQKTASLSQSGMTDSGAKMADGLVNGIGGKQAELENKISSMVDSAAQKVRGKYKSWYDVGAYLIRGMVNGIRSQQSSLEAEVKKLEDKAERAVKAKAKIQSPSKVWAKIGSYMGQGLINGIAESEHGVQVAALGLAAVSEEAINSAIYSISDAINSNLDVAPTITPVVDLSNVAAAGGYISSSFARNQAIGISRIMNGTPNALAYATDSIINGISSQNQNGTLDPERIYEAVRQGASQAEIKGITLNGRELKRGLKDMGVVTR